MVPRWATSPMSREPDLTPHHRVQAVYRLVQDQQVGVAAQSQPEGGLLLHPLGQAADGLFLVYCREGLLQHLIALVIKGGIQPPVKLHHVPGGGGQKVVQVVGDKGHPGLHRRIFVHRRPVHRDGARVGAVDAGDVPQDGGLSRAVRAHQPIDGALLHLHGEPIQGAEAVEGLDDVVYLDHWTSPPFSRMRAISRSRVTPRYSSSAVRLSNCPSSRSRRSSSTPVRGAAKLPFPGIE